MGCSLGTNAQGNVELDIGTISLILDPKNGLEVKSKVIDQLINNLSAYNPTSQLLISHLANHVLPSNPPVLLRQ